MITLAPKNLCCGCTACAAVCPHHCIQLTKDDEGFLYPHINHDLCVSCGRCEEICPTIRPQEMHEPADSYAAVHTDAAIRQKSSSGGFFTALAEETIGQGGVVFGARFDEHFCLVHGYADSVEGLEAFRGSKYVQSEMGDNFRKAKDFLREGRKVLFCGTGCQVAGLKAYLGRPYENLLTLDILCHGVASPSVWKSYLQQCVVRTDEKMEKLQSVSFRDKRNGWKAYGFKLQFTDKEVFSAQADNHYMKGYFANLYLRPSCHRCPFRHFSCGSDLTTGDCWGIEQHPLMPECSDDKGMNIVFVHTAKGALGLERVTGKLHLVPVHYHALVKKNPAILHCAVPYPQRAEFFQRWRTGESLISLIDRYTRPSAYKRTETLFTPLLKALGIKGFTNRFRK